MDRQSHLRPTPEEIQQTSVGKDRFTDIYTKTPPWDIGKPQPEFVEAVNLFPVQSPVLDAGCGTGDLSLHLATLGYEVTGVDFVEAAISAARVKSEATGVSADFRLHDALALGDLGKRFATFFDCGLFHTFSDEDRPRYVNSLISAAAPGARLYLMCFSENETREKGPRRVTQAEIREAFEPRWEIGEIRPALFEASIFPGGAKAWFARMRLKD
jgi:SAM-dependent methyltransferase